MQNFGFGVVLPAPAVSAGTLVLALAIDRTHDQLAQSKETTTQIHAHLMYACARPMWSISTFCFALPSVPGANLPLVCLLALFVIEFFAFTYSIDTEDASCKNQRKQRYGVHVHLYAHGY